MERELRVLLVEDDAIIAYMLEKMVEKSQAKVVSKCMLGEDALSCFENSMPDLVFMDIRLAGSMSGIEAARLILSKYKALIVFMTAYQSEQYEKELQDLDFFGFYEKPVSIDQVRALVAQVRSFLETSSEA